MKKAFTLIELLVVIAIIAILAAMLMPSLSRARQQAKSSNCRGNLRNQGLALAMLRNDEGGLYPGLVGYAAVDDAYDGTYFGVADAIDPERWVEVSEPWHRIVEYGESVDIIDDPGWQAKKATTFCWGAPRVVNGDKVPGCVFGDFDACIGPWGQTCAKFGTIVSGAEYMFDFGRIAKNSNPGRVIIACSPRLEHRWGQNYGLVQFAHREGSNVLFVDGSVRMATRQHPEAIWGAPAIAGQQYYFEGYTGNPRLDEDSYLARATAESEDFKAQLETDIDSVYVCDVQAPNYNANPPDNTLHPFEGFDDPDRGHEAGTQWDRSWVPSKVSDDGDTTNDEFAPTPGYVCEPWDPWAQGSGYNENTWRPYRYDQEWYWYEERGIFATEARWNKVDSRCAPMGPWKKFGSAGVSEDPLPEF